MVYAELEIIERYGSGIHRMLDACAAAGLPEPTIEESTGGVVITFRKATKREPAGAESLLGRRQSAEQVGVHDGVHDGVHELRMTEVMQMILASINMPASTPEILKALGYPRRTRNYSAAMKSLLDAGLIEMTIPDKPRSRMQKYRLTEKGRRRLARQGVGAKEPRHE